MKARRLVHHKWLLLVLGLALAFFIPLGSQAADPAAGTVSEGSPEVTWTGPFKAPTASANCGGDNNPACDNFKLTIGTHSFSNWVVEIKLQPFAAGDWDLQVYDPGGNLIGSSGNAPSQLEQVTLTNPAGGTYTVSGAPFAPAPGLTSYSASATLREVAAPPPPPPPGGENVTYQNAVAPAPLGRGAAEPSIGANWKSGRTMYQSGLETLQVTWDDCSSPAEPAWKDVTFLPTSLVSLDPIGFCDSKTGRWFTSQLSANCSTAAFTDDDGANWTPSQGCGINSGVDHQSIGGGPFHAPLTRDPNGPVYPNAVYYCAQDVAAALCARSDNGGLTFGPGVPIYDLTECGGLHGEPKVAPDDGTVYVPNKNCNGNPAVVVSEDNGLTWDVRPVPDTTNGEWDPGVSIATDGTVYLAYADASGKPKVAMSPSKGHSWPKIRTVGQSISFAGKTGIQQTAFPVAVAGDPDRAAAAWLGSTETTPGGGGDNPNWPGEWHLIIAHTYDGGDTWTTIDATPDDPVQRGTICTGGFGGCNNGTRNLLDFNRGTVDKFGRAMIGYADGCVGACITGPPNSFTDIATIARQVNGKRLFAQYDVLGPPAAPGNVSAKTSAGPPPANIVNWSAPDDHGSPITGYSVYRRTQSTTRAVIASVGPDVRSYEDTAIVAGQTYFYSVTATNAEGESPFCKEVVPEGGPPPEDPCTFPGVTVLTDGTGDATGGNSAHDVEKLSIAEPADLGAGKMMFVLKVASLASVPPDTTWPVLFKAPNSTDYAVRMHTGATGPPSFTVATGANNTNPILNPGTPADPTSTFDADGTIKIVVARSAIGNPMPGENLSQFLVRIRIEGGAIALTPDNMPDSLARTGSYLVKGSENCGVSHPDLTLASSDIAFSSTKIVGGDRVTITATVHNIGTADATNVGVRFTDNGAPIGAVQTIASIAMNGGTGTAQVVWDTKHLKDVHTITVTADPANSILEFDEANNTASRDAFVRGNKVKNGSFESSSTGSSPNNWSSSGESGYAQGGSDGSKSVTAGTTGAWVSDPIDVQPTAGHGFSVAVNGAGGTLIVQQLSAAGAVLASLTLPLPAVAGSAFDVVTGSLTTLAGTSQVRVKLAGPVAGTTGFDDVRLWAEAP